MDIKETLERERPETVKFLEKLKFQWINQDPHGNKWHGYIFASRSGHVISFSYDDLAAHDTAWLKRRFAYGLRSFKTH